MNTLRHIGLAREPTEVLSEWRRWLEGLLVSTLLIAGVTVTIWLLEPHVPVLGLGVLYLFAVLPVAVFWGLALGVPVSVASMLAFNFFFLPPTHTFTLADSSNWLALGVFLVTAVVVSDLAARSRRRATESTLLAEISASLLESGDVSAELERIADDAAQALHVERARIVVGSDALPAGKSDRYPLLAGGRRVGTIYIEGPRQGTSGRSSDSTASFLRRLPGVAATASLLRSCNGSWCTRLARP